MIDEARKSREGMKPQLSDTSRARLPRLTLADFPRFQPEIGPFAFEFFHITFPLDALRLITDKVSLNSIIVLDMYLNLLDVDT